MPTLAKYKSDYKKRKTLRGKESVTRSAMLNLSDIDNQKFCNWIRKSSIERQ